MLYLAFIILFAVLWAGLGVALPTLWRGVSALANRAAAASLRFGVGKRFTQATSPFRDYLPVVLIVIPGLLLAAWAGDQFLDLAELVHVKSPLLQHIDTSVHDWAIARRYADATSFFTLMSTVGGPVGVAIIGAIAVAVLLFQKHYHRIGYLAITALGGGALDWELKRYFARARPDVAEMLRRASGYSFPSGHAMGSTVVFSAIAYVAFRGLQHWRWKAAAIALCITLILSVALSRVYLGVHWISDVGAGITCGLLWVTGTTVAYETFRRIQLIRRLRVRGGVKAMPEDQI
jgi:membrane-associated phospholipid phosphatase